MPTARLVSEFAQRGSTTTPSLLFQTCRSSYDSPTDHCRSHLAGRTPDEETPCQPDNIGSHLLHISVKSDHIVQWSWAEHESVRKGNTTTDSATLLCLPPPLWHCGVIKAGFRIWNCQNNSWSEVVVVPSSRDHLLSFCCVSQLLLFSSLRVHPPSS